VLRGPLRGRRGGGNFPRRGSVSALPATAAGFTPGPPRPLAAAAAAASAAAPSTRAGLEPSEQPAHVGATTVFNWAAFNRRRACSSISSRFFADHAPPPSSGSRSTLAGGPNSRFLSRLLAAATRQHRQLDRSFLQVFWKSLSGGQPAAGSNGGHRWPPWPPTGNSPSPRMGGTPPVLYRGLHQARSASCPAMTTSRRMWARIPTLPGAGLCLMATYWLRNHEVVFLRSLPPGAPAGRTAYWRVLSPPARP